MALYGCPVVEFAKFTGVVTAVDPEQVGDGQASDAVNVEFTDLAVSSRRGRAPYNATPAVASGVNGFHFHYPPTGTRKAMLQAGSAVYEDDGAGAFSAVVTGLTGGTAFDFVPWKDVVYAGSGADSLRKRAADGTWGAVALMVPPSPGPTLSVERLVVENFDSTTGGGSSAKDPTTGWVQSGSHINLVSGNGNNVAALQGADSLGMRPTAAGAEGEFMFKAWSLSAVRRTTINHVGGYTAGSTSLVVTDASKFGVGDYLQIAGDSTSGHDPEIVKVSAVNTGTNTVTLSAALLKDHSNSVNVSAVGVDLSEAAYLAVSYQASRIGMVFQIGITDNAGNLDFSLFDTITTNQQDAWVTVRVSLAGIPPASRTASRGIGIKWIGKPSGTSYPQTVYLDQAMPQGPLVADAYLYSATNATVATIDGVDVVSAESNPTDLAKFTLDADPATFGLVVTPDANDVPPTGANVRRFFRYRDTGTFRAARMIGSAPIGGSTLTAGIDPAATSLSLSSTTGLSPGNVLTIDATGTAERVLVTGLVSSVSGSTTTVTVTVTRGFGGDTPASHVSGKTVAFTAHLDTLSDGTIAIMDPDELQRGKINPPPAATYAVANGRLVAGNVTLGSTNYPYRLYLSRLGFPEEFSTAQTPGTGPEIAGWVDLPTHHHIRRVLEFDGQALIFTDRGIWTLEGSGWDDFVLRQRGYFGLDARWAVCIGDRAVYWLSQDGVRVVAPNRGFDGLFDTWLVSEPVADLLAAIPAVYRGNACMGLDDLGRLHLSYTGPGQTVNDRAVVFDPRLSGTLEFSSYTGGLIPEHTRNPLRNGWTYFMNWGFGSFHRLQNGGGDEGQLVGADPGSGRIHYLLRNSSGSDLMTDDATGTSAGPVSWYWQGKSLDAGIGNKFEWVVVAAQFNANGALATTMSQPGGMSSSGTSVVVADASGLLVNDYVQIDGEALLVTGIAGNTLTVTRGQVNSIASGHTDGTTVYRVQVVTATPILDGSASGTTYSLSLGPNTSGYVTPFRRTAPGVRAQISTLRLSGSHRSTIKFRAARFGAFSRLGGK